MPVSPSRNSRRPLRPAASITSCGTCLAPGPSDLPRLFIQLPNGSLDMTLGVFANGFDTGLKALEVAGMRRHQRVGVDRR